MMLGKSGKEGTEGKRKRPRGKEEREEELPLCTARLSGELYEGENRLEVSRFL